MAVGYGTTSPRTSGSRSFEGIGPNREVARRPSPAESVDQVDRVPRRRHARWGPRRCTQPRLWPEYHAHYYGAFVRDPDGNNVEAVCHTAPGRLTRPSAPRGAGAVGEDGAVSTAIPSPIPHGRTARRLEWAHLPPAVRERDRAALRVAGRRRPTSQGGGFTPGFASVLTCEDGSRHFVKAASTAAQRAFAESYREEARKLRALPDTIPAPRLLWSHRRRLGRARPRVRRGAGAAAPLAAPTELDACLDTLETVRRPAHSLRRPGLELDPITDEFAAWPAFWDHVNATRDLPHGDEAAALAAGFADVGRRRDAGATPTSATTTCCWRPTGARCSATGTGRRWAPTGSTPSSC